MDKDKRTAAAASINSGHPACVLIASITSFMPLSSVTILALSSKMIDSLRKMGSFIHVQTK